jgi:P-type Mg2+ transporter
MRSEARIPPVGRRPAIDADRRPAARGPDSTGPTIGEAAALPGEAVLAQLASSPAGLSDAEVARRRLAAGPNAVRSHSVQPLRILGRQFRNAVLILLTVTAVISFFLGQRADSTVIGIILLASVGLGFVNEYRAERATDALHSGVRHRCVVLRDGRPTEVDVTELVPGDVVRLTLGEVVPADLRLLEVTGLQCDESLLTGESLPAEKSTDPVPPGSALGDLSSCAFMGTVVHAGSGTGIVVATGPHAEFGRIAVGLGDRQPETDFQAGLRRFSVLLLQVALVLTVLIFAANLILHRPLLEALLFSLAIAVGMTPQLLPAVVSTSLATGSRQLARRKVLVKRLVCIEDLGDLDILVTDKTGTLTDGRITFMAALDPAGGPADAVVRLGLLATEMDPAEAGAGAVGGNPLDAALWQTAPGISGAGTAGYTRLGLVPFDHDRRMTSAVVRAPDGAALLVVKGAPEQVLACCTDVTPAAHTTLDAQFAAGGRVVAVATRPAGDLTRPTGATSAICGWPDSWSSVIRRRPPPLRP